MEKINDYRSIKTYEDACEKLGVKPMKRIIVETEDGQQEVSDIAHVAYMKLCTIVRALNDNPGFPRFTLDEYRCYPWFYLYDKEEIDNMDEDKRKRIILFGGDADAGARCGLACADSDRGWSGSYAAVGSRLCLKNNELAIYCGIQFKDLWKDFYVGIE